MTREDKLLCPDPAWSIILTWLWSQRHHDTMLSRALGLTCIEDYIKDLKHFRALISLLVFEIVQQSLTLGVMRNNEKNRMLQTIQTIPGHRKHLIITGAALFFLTLVTDTLTQPRSAQTRVFARN